MECARANVSVLTVDYREREGHSTRGYHRSGQLQSHLRAAILRMRKVLRMRDSTPTLLGVNQSWPIEWKAEQRVEGGLTEPGEGKGSSTCSFGKLGED